MIIIKQGENYIVNFDLFSDAQYSANNVIGELTYNPAELNLVDIIVSPAIGTRSLLNTDQYMFGSVLPNKHYVVACEFEVLDEKQNLPIQWSVTTSSNELNLVNNNTAINLVEYLNGVLAEDLALLVADGKLIPVAVNAPYTGTELPATPGSVINDAALQRFTNGIVVAYKWNGTVWTAIFSSDWGEKRICLNSVSLPLTAFEPVDLYQPTIAEVNSWVAANYASDLVLKRNGTQLSYFAPTYLDNPVATASNSCTHPTHIWTLSDSANPIVLTYRRTVKHTNELQNGIFTGEQVPTFDGEQYGDTATVTFAGNNKVVNYTWQFINWSVDGDVTQNVYKLTHVLNELGFPVLATNYTNNKEFVLTAQDGLLTVSPIYLGKYTTITSVQYMLDGVLGDYTGNNYNGIGLYYYNPTLDRLELVGKTANDLNIWEDPIGVLQTKDFEDPIVAFPGLYYIAYLYNQSAQVAAPGFLAINETNDPGPQFAEYSNDPLELPVLIAALDGVKVPIPFNALDFSGTHVEGDLLTGGFAVTKTGWYEFNLNLEFNFQNAGELVFYMYKNASIDPLIYAKGYSGGAAASGTGSISANKRIYLQVGDILDCVVHKSAPLGATLATFGTTLMSLTRVPLNDKDAALQFSSKFLGAYNVDNVTLKTLQYSGKDSLPLVIQTTDANVTLGCKVCYSLL